LFVRGKTAINCAESKAPQYKTVLKVRHHSTKFSCPGEQAPGVCAALVAKFPLCTVGLDAL